jgi:hypothetical protein
MGERAPAGAENTAAETDAAAVLRSLRPTWVDPGKLRKRVEIDRWIKRLKQKRAEKAAEPLPGPETKRPLWTAVQTALAAWMKVHFAREYRQIELRKIDEQIKRRVLALRHRLQAQRVNTLRGTVGLHHLKQLQVRGAQLRSK